MKVKDILAIMRKIERLQNKLVNKEELDTIDKKDIGSILIRYNCILENMRIKDDEN